MRFTIKGTSFWCNLCGIKMRPYRLPFGVLCERCPKCGATVKVAKRGGDFPRGTNRKKRKRREEDE